MAKKDKWFKHYNSSHEGQSIQECLASGRHFLVVLHWTLLELVSRYEDENERGKLIISEDLLKKKLSVRADFLQRSLKDHAEIFKTSLKEILEGSLKKWEIFIPNWSELQERRGGKTEAKQAQNKSETPTDLRRKTEDKRHKTKDVRETQNIFAESEPSSVHALAADPDTKQFLSGIKNQVFEAWEKLYPIDWIRSEVLKAIAWCAANTARAPKGKTRSRFMNEWLARGWEFHRKTIASNPVPSGTPPKDPAKEQARLDQLRKEMGFT